MTANSEAKVIEYFYALASPWSYLGNEELRRIAFRFGVTIEPYIIDYDQMFEAAGTVPLPRRPALRKAYRLVELKRWSERRGVRLNPEPQFYRGEVEEPDERDAALVVTAAKLAGLDSLRLGHALGRALWAEERHPFHADEIEAICVSEGFEYEALSSAHARAAAVAAYQRATDYSISRRVFGMPFYLLGDTPFWGQDRLELLETAVQASIGKPAH